MSGSCCSCKKKITTNINIVDGVVSMPTKILPTPPYPTHHPLLLFPYTEHYYIIKHVSHFDIGYIRCGFA
jgi:hypothetical protein